PTVDTNRNGPSTSMSFASSEPAGIATGVLSTAATLSSMAIGGSLTAATWTVTRPGSESVPSETGDSNVAAPLKSGAGVNVIVPPASVAVQFVKFPTAVIDRLGPSTSVSFASSVAVSIACGVSSTPASTSSTATGASLTAATLTTTSAVAVSVPSET